MRVTSLFAGGNRFTMWRMTHVLEAAVLSAAIACAAAVVLSWLQGYSVVVGGAAVAGVGAYVAVDTLVIFNRIESLTRWCDRRRWEFATAAGVRFGALVTFWYWIATSNSYQAAIWGGAMVTVHLLGTAAYGSKRLQYYRLLKDRVDTEIGATAA